jgi:hypothetical protein
MIDKGCFLLCAIINERIIAQAIQSITYKAACRGTYRSRNWTSHQARSIAQDGSAFEEVGAMAPVHKLLLACAPAPQLNLLWNQ